MENAELIPFATAQELVQAVTNMWLDQIARSNGAGALHCVALSGGRISQRFFSAIVEQSAAAAVSLEAIHFFWADERCVPPDDAESNFRMARELLFGPLKIRDSRVHRIHGEKLPEAAAADAASELCGLAPRNPDGQPVLDLIFLGIGEDGHVASLFPGEAESVVADKTVYRAVKNSPKPPPNRVTLGYPAITAAKQVWVLASGAGKEAALRESLSPGGKTPLARVLRMREHTRIFSDVRVG